MPQRHPYSTLQIPPTAPFKLQPSPGKGWGAFATRRIPKGSLILAETPLFSIPKHHEEITETDVHIAFQSLSPPQKQQFFSLRNNASTPFPTMTTAFAENSFGRSTEPGPAAIGLYILHSRFNHSCLPNAKIPRTDPTEGIASVAMRDIARGEEITFCYETDFEGRTRRERHEILQFVCECRACVPGTEFQAASELRRVMVRGLQYLTLGRDLDGEKHGGHGRSAARRPIIFDPALKKAAEDLEIPSSSRLVYILLTLVLLEEEGLLDRHLIERFEPSLQFTYRSFRLESSARIARLAMVQETWMERFCVAMRLWGRDDPDDVNVQAVLKAVRELQEAQGR